MKLNKKDNPIMVGTIDRYRWIYIGIDTDINLVLSLNSDHSGWSTRAHYLELPTHETCFQGWGGTRENTRPATMKEQERFLTAYPVLRTIYKTTKTCR